MKNIKLSIAAALLTTTFAMAGGNVSPIAPVVEVVEEPAASVFYAGIGYSCLQADFHSPAYVDLRSMSAISLTAGYNVNEYLAIEGRYTGSIGDVEVETNYSSTDEDMDLSNIAVYLKPQYTMGIATIYGLLGYGQFTIDDSESFSGSSVQYGAGFSVMATDSLSVYADYRSLFNSEDFDGLSLDETVHANSYTVGINYHF